MRGPTSRGGATARGPMPRCRFARVDGRGSGVVRAAAVTRTITGALREALSMAVDQAKVREFAEKMFGDLGSAASIALDLAGDRLGLWKAMAGAGPLTSAEPAARTRTPERHVREWLCATAAA